MFRLLKANEIDVRVQTVKEKLKRNSKIKMINEDNARFEYAEEILDLLEV